LGNEGKVAGRGMLLLIGGNKMDGIFTELDRNFDANILNGKFI
jgi:hypothetical protein